MDIIQRMVLLMDNLVQRIRNIADLLKKDSAVSSEDDKTGFRLFWIFNW